MKTKNNIYLSFFTIFLLTLFGCADLNFGARNVSSVDDKITIGWVGPLTGDVAAYGIPIQQVVALAAAEINVAGGVNGKQLEIIYESGGCDPKTALSAAQKLVSVDEVDVIIGGFCSGETLGIAPFAEEQGVLLLSVGSSHPDITYAGDYVFRNCPSDAYSASKVAEYAGSVGYKQVAVISETSDYAQGQRNVFKEHFNGEIVADVAFSAEELDMRAQVTLVKGADPDAVFVVTNSPEKTGQLLDHIRSLLGVDFPVLMNEFAETPVLFEEYTEHMEGVVYSVVKFDEESSELVYLLEKLEMEYVDFDIGLSKAYLATGYDAVYLLKEAIETVGEDASLIKDYLYTVENREGVAGVLAFDEYGDAMMEMELKKIVSGVRVSLEE